MSPDATCSDPKLGALLTAYEMDLLVREQRAIFEDHLTHCDACLDELYRIAPYTTAMRTAPREILARLESRTDPASSATARPVLVRPWWSRLRLPVLVPVAAAAAAILLLVRPTGAPASFGDLALVEPLPWTTVDRRAGENEPERLFRSGMKDYAKGDYDAAVASLSLAVLRGSIESEWSNLDHARLYLGLSLLLTDDPQGSRPHLEAAARSDTPPLRDRARWFLAQSLLLSEDGEGALQILNGLSDSPGYGRRAGTLAGEVRARLE